MRQRTSRPSVRVSARRTRLAASHSSRGEAAAGRRWCVRTCGAPSQASRRRSGVSSRSGMRPIQHKREAWWFYRFLSLGYDRWVNPLFWTEPMRDAALALARLDRPDLDVVDVGAGTGFTTSGILRAVAPERVTMIDQSPHQLARARRKPALA